MAFLKQILSCHSLLKITGQWDNPSINALRAPPCPREDIQSFQLELKAWALLVSPASALLSSDYLACTVHPGHIALVSYFRHASLSCAFLSAHPVVFYAHSHLLHLRTSCLILKASSGLTSSGKPSLVAVGRVCGFLFLPFFSYMTTHVFVTVCQLAYLCFLYLTHDCVPSRISIDAWSSHVGFVSWLNE